MYTRVFRYCMRLTAYVFRKSKNIVDSWKGFHCRCYYKVKTKLPRIITLHSHLFCDYNLFLYLWDSSFLCCYSVCRSTLIHKCH